MSDKLSGLLEGFSQSSQRIEKVSEAIISLHEVMDKFHETANSFAIKNEMDTLLPEIDKHFSKVNDMYDGINENLKKIQKTTTTVKSNGKTCSEHIEKSWHELNSIHEYLQKYLDEIIPFYKNLEPQMAMAQKFQQSTGQGMKEMHDFVQKIENMQNDLTIVIAKQQETLHHTVDSILGEVNCSFGNLTETVITLSNDMKQFPIYAKKAASDVSILCSASNSEWMKLRDEFQSICEIFKQVSQQVNGTSQVASVVIADADTANKKLTELISSYIQSQHDMQDELSKVHNEILACQQETEDIRAFYTGVASEQITQFKTATDDFAKEFNNVTASAAVWKKGLNDEVTELKLTTQIIQAMSLGQGELKSSFSALAAEGDSIKRKFQTMVDEVQRVNLESLKSQDETRRILENQKEILDLQKMNNQQLVEYTECIEEIRSVRAEMEEMREENRQLTSTLQQIQSLFERDTVGKVKNKSEEDKVDLFTGVVEFVTRKKK